MLFKLAFVVAIVSVSAVDIAKSLKCYSCESNNQGLGTDDEGRKNACQYERTDTCPVVDCKYGEVCVGKLEKKNQSVFRGCMKLADCQKGNTPDFHCKSCGKDLCNKGKLIPL